MGREIPARNSDSPCTFATFKLLKSCAARDLQLGDIRIRLRPQRTDLTGPWTDAFFKNGPPVGLDNGHFNGTTQNPSLVE